VFSFTVAQKEIANSLNPIAKMGPEPQTPLFAFPAFSIPIMSSARSQATGQGKEEASKPENGGRKPCGTETGRIPFGVGCITDGPTRLASRTVSKTRWNRFAETSQSPASESEGERTSKERDLLGARDGAPSPREVAC